MNDVVPDVDADDVFDDLLHYCYQQSPVYGPTPGILHVMSKYADFSHNFRGNIFKFHKLLLFIINQIQLQKRRYQNSNHHYVVNNFYFVG